MSKRLLLVAVAALVALAVAVPASANMQPPMDLIPDGDQPTIIESVELMVWASLKVDTEWARPSSLKGEPKRTLRSAYSRPAMTWRATMRMRGERSRAAPPIRMGGMTARIGLRTDSITRDRAS